MVMAGPGTGILKRRIERHDVVLDGRKATISAEIPEEKGTRGYVEEDVVYTNPSELLRSERNVLPSLSLIRFVKVKNFIDGVYAVAEETIAKKGHKLSRPDFLRDLEKW